MFASALSDAHDLDTALDEVVPALAERLGGPADLVVVFVTPQFRDALDRVGRRLDRALAPRLVIGCTAEGVIGVRRELEQTPGLSVLAAASGAASFEPLTYEKFGGSAEDRPAALREAVRSHDSSDLRAVVLLADPFSTPMVKLLPAFGEAFGGVPVVGGMASGARAAGQNRLLLNGSILDQGAVGFAVRGDLEVQTTVSQGCRPIGLPLVITRSRRHVVQELGGRNALSVVRDMVRDLDEAAQRLVQGNGLLIGRVINEYKSRFGPGDFLIRGLTGVDPDAGYIAIGDPQVRVGQTVQFHVRDGKSAADDFTLLLQAQKIYGTGAGSLLFSCNGRGTRLFEHEHADASAVHDAMGDMPLAGFFAAGEIGPVGKENFLHGHTASLVVFRCAASGREE